MTPNEKLDRLALEHILSTCYSMKPEDLELIRSIKPIIKTNFNKVILDIIELQNIRDRIEVIKYEQVKSRRMPKMPSGYGFETVGFLNHILKEPKKVKT